MWYRFFFLSYINFDSRLTKCQSITKYTITRTSFHYWTLRTLENANECLSFLDVINLSNAYENISIIELTKLLKIQTNKIPLLKLQIYTKYKWTSFLYWTYKTVHNTNGRLSFIELTKPYKIQMNIFPSFNIQTILNIDQRLSFIGLKKPYKIQTNSFILVNLQTQQYKLQTGVFPLLYLHVTNPYKI